MRYPTTRLRRLRYNKHLRGLFKDVYLSSKDLIQPIFVCEGQGVKKPIEGLPGQFQLSVDNVINYCHDLKEKKINSIILFGVINIKDNDGHIACSENSIIPNCIRQIKKHVNDIFVIADLCNCEYTQHGHCGTVVDGDVDNDQTLITLSKQALVFARAGVDAIAPSDMMDGRVGFIRKLLDQEGYYKIPIFPYSVKFASSFYGPFRQAANVTLDSGDRKSYQMNYQNSYNFYNEIKLDINEGADAVIIKPALCYLDIISAVKSDFHIPVIAYNVSGEYSMLQAASEMKYLNKNECVIEMLIAMKRAGANSIITYHAFEIAEFLIDYNNV